MKVVVCGGGNAIHVLSSYIGSKPDYEVSVWSTFNEEAKDLASALNEKGIQCINDMGPDVYGKPIKISDKAKDVIPDCDMVILALPAFAHESYLQAMAPYIKESGVILGALPGRGGFDMCVRHVFGAELANRCIIFATETLPWACRVQTFGQTVQVLGTKKDIDFAVSPLDQTPHIASVLTNLLGPAPIFHPVDSFLSVTLMNISSLWHPTITYGQYRDWDGHTPFTTPPLFYQGVDEFTSHQLSLMSDEVMTIKSTLEKNYPTIKLEAVRHVSEWMRRSYGQDIADTSSLHRMLQTNKGYKGLCHRMTETPEGLFIPDFTARYLTEDVPCGLVVTRGIAELLAIPTPHLDKVLVWAQKQLKKEFLVDGKLTGKDLMLTRCPQRFGFRTVEEFIKVNGYCYT